MKYFTGIKDLDIKIINYLDDNNLFNIIRTNKYLYLLTCNDNFWMNRVIKKYGKIIGGPEYIKVNFIDSNWKNYYIFVKKLLLLNINDTLEYAKNNKRYDLLNIISECIRLQRTIDINIHRDEFNLVKAVLRNPLFNPSVNDNEIISICSFFGYEDILIEILKDPRVNPSSNENEPLKLAVKNNHIEIVKLLIEDKRFKIINIEEIIELAECNNRFEIQDYLEDFKNP